MPAAAVTTALTCQHQALPLPPCMAVQAVDRDAPGAPQEALMGALQDHISTSEGTWQGRCSARQAQCGMQVPQA